MNNKQTSKQTRSTPVAAAQATAHPPNTALRGGVSGAAIPLAHAAALERRQHTMHPRVCPPACRPVLQTDPEPTYQITVELSSLAAAMTSHNYQHIHVGPVLPTTHQPHAGCAATRMESDGAPETAMLEQKSTRACQQLCVPTARACRI